MPVEGTAADILTIRHLIDRARANREELNLAFVDITKAFDTIPHEAIRNVLGRHGIPSSVINIIKSMYENAFTQVSVGRMKQTERQWIRRGIKQGCPLSPLLSCAR